jgi:hypothetical protein
VEQIQPGVVKKDDVQFDDVQEQRQRHVRVLVHHVEQYYTMVDVQHINHHQ